MKAIYRTNNFIYTPEIVEMVADKIRKQKLIKMINPNKVYKRDERANFVNSMQSVAGYFFTDCNKIYCKKFKNQNPAAAFSTILHETFHIMQNHNPDELIDEKYRQPITDEEIISGYRRELTYQIEVDALASNIVFELAVAKLQNADITKEELETKRDKAIKGLYGVLKSDYGLFDLKSEEEVYNDFRERMKYIASIWKNLNPICEVILEQSKIKFPEA